MDLTRMRYFVVLAEELHFGRAALRLNIVQPAISQQTRQLEKELGVRLLDRSSRQVSLTDAGKVFLVEARRVLQQADMARKLARDAAEGVAGELAIGFVDNAIWAVLPGIVREFRARFPLVKLDLKQMSRRPQVEALESGELDIGIMPGPVQQVSLIAQPLLEAQLHVVLPRGHRLCELKSVPIAALAEEPFVSFPSTADSRRIDEIIMDQCAQAGFTPILAQPVQQMHTALALVSAGFGVAFVPPWMGRAWTDNVEYRPLTPRTVYSLMLVKRADRNRPVTTSFEQVAQRYVKGLAENTFFTAPPS
jgi:DNA-binding transcriptional LysR family regulator